MAVFKSVARVVDREGVPIGLGNAFIHLTSGIDVEQVGTGTLSLRTWHPGESLPAALLLDDGRELPIDVASDVLSTCSQNHILRYRAHWPPVVPE
jgi:hypothetical protein